MVLTLPCIMMHFVPFKLGLLATVLNDSFFIVPVEKSLNDFIVCCVLQGELHRYLYKNKIV